MTNRSEPLREQMLAVYGAGISRWPRGRRDGWLGLATSTAFRRQWRDARALDQAIESAASPLRDGARLERRLLAAMGLAEQEAPAMLLPRFHMGLKAAAAVTCLSLGMALGGAFGGGALDDSVYAVISDDDWTEIEAESFFFLEDAG